MERPVGLNSMKEARPGLTEVHDVDFVKEASSAGGNSSLEGVSAVNGSSHFLSSISGLKREMSRMQSFNDFY